MKLKTFFFAIVLNLLAASCAKDDPSPSPNPVPPTPETAFKGIVFATGVTNPEGNSGTVYMQSLADMLPGTYDNKHGMPTGFGITPIALPNGNIYSFPDYMGNSKAEVVRYNIDARGNWVKKGALPVPAGARAANVVELNESKAYLSMQGIGMVRVFNPTTMTKIKDIDLNSLKHEGTNVSPSTMIIRDGKLYVGLNQMNAQWMPNDKSIELAMIDTKTDELQKHIVNKTLGLSFATRPVDANSIFMDENKDIYINCIGSFGFIPDYPGGIARIKNGTDKIDPDYCIRFDKTEIGGLNGLKGEFLSTILYGGNGKLYAYANVYAMDPNAMTNPYVCLSNVPVVIDLARKTVERIEGMEISNPQGIAIGKYKDLIVFGSANKKANGFYTYRPETKEVKGPVMQVKGNPSLFYSYVR